MNLFLEIAIIAVSIIVIITVMLQESKTDGISVILGSSDQQLGSPKSLDKEAILRRITIVTSIILLILSVVGLLFIK